MLPDQISTPPRWLLVGHGNLGQALAMSWHQKGLSHADCWIIDRNNPPPDSFPGAYAKSVDDLPNNSIFDIAILAIKPQQACAGILPSKKLITVDAWLSVMAGLPVETIARILGGQPKIIRAMPNICARISASVTGVWAPAETEHSAIEATNLLLGAIGRCVWLKSEKQIDSFTAIYGSGPAYIYAFAEALVEAGQQLDSEIGSEAIVMEMLQGALELYCASNSNLADLRNSVTSRGGTTEAALDILTADEPRPSLKTLVRVATDLARQRSKNLGTEAKRSAEIARVKAQDKEDKER